MGSIRIHVRRILGRRGTFMLRNILSEISYRLKLIPAANSLGKDDCISAMVCTYNDPDWLEISLLSIRDLVHEYVVVDSSTDETPHILERLRDEYGLDIKLYRSTPGDLVEARNIVLKNVSCRWILHWDSDFVAKPEMVTTLRSLIENLDPRKYYLVYWPHINICVDLEHLCGRPLHVEHWLFTWSPKLKYVWIDKYDSLIAPIHMYKVIYIDKPLSIHLAWVRNPARYAFKSLWWRFREEFNKAASQGIDLWKLAEEKARSIYGIADLEKLGVQLMLKQLNKLPRYDETAYGPLPDYLVNYAIRKKLYKPWSTADIKDIDVT